LWGGGGGCGTAKVSFGTTRKNIGKDICNKDIKKIQKRGGELVKKKKDQIKTALEKVTKE